MDFFLKGKKETPHWLRGFAVLKTCWPRMYPQAHRLTTQLWEPGGRYVRDSSHHHKVVLYHVSGTRPAHLPPADWIGDAALSAAETPCPRMQGSPTEGDPGRHRSPSYPNCGPQDGPSTYRRWSVLRSGCPDLGEQVRAVTTQTGHVSFLGEELVILPGLQERPEGLTDRPQKDLCLNGKLRGCGFVTCELTIPGRAALASAPVFLFCMCSYGCFCWLILAHKGAQMAVFLSVRLIQC